MEQLDQIEQQIIALLQSSNYPDDFPEQLEQFVLARHQIVESILSDRDNLTREQFNAVVLRTQQMKDVLQQHKQIIADKLLQAKRSEKSVSLYQRYQNKL
ncbi:flagellar biosynthesis protein FliS [Photobacterium damselae]|uniref:flagellar biosynthesis protein FliS n=1 Tax=Photobacterium damselae TaxID=38293 RepID=UPI000D04ADF5|nr:flagellar biosynthesis protein FliS [Photobacterium damselae]PSB80193.1 flagellar biosynthesis protein FliS [Photobacterium damselae subsp. damselae]